MTFKMLGILLLQFIMKHSNSQCCYEHIHILVVCVLFDNVEKEYSFKKLSKDICKYIKSILYSRLSVDAYVQTLNWTEASVYCSWFMPVECVATVYSQLIGTINKDISRNIHIFCTAITRLIFHYLISTMYWFFKCCLLMSRCVKLWCYCFFLSSIQRLMNFMFLCFFFIFLFIFVWWIIMWFIVCWDHGFLIKTMIVSILSISACY